MFEIQRLFRFFTYGTIVFIAIICSFIFLYQGQKYDVQEMRRLQDTVRFANSSGLSIYNETVNARFLLTYANPTLYRNQAPFTIEAYPISTLGTIR